MPSYCLLADLKTYLGVAATTDDDLMQSMLDAATNRIDTFCARNFQAAADSVRYFDPLANAYGEYLWLDQDLSYLTSVVNGDSVNITTDLVTQPRNDTPYYALKIKASQSSYWTYDTTPENAITITGRWAYMERAAITAISRTSNVVSASVVAPRLTVGASVFVLAVADSTFNGTFTVVSNNGATITWAQTASNDTDTTGIILYTPTDIVTACRRLASWLYRQKDTQQGDLDRPILAGDGSVIMPSTLPKDISDMLIPYQKRVRN